MSAPSETIAERPSSVLGTHLTSFLTHLKPVKKFSHTPFSYYHTMNRYDEYIDLFGTIPNRNGYTHVIKRDGDLVKEIAICLTLPEILYEKNEEGLPQSLPQIRYVEHIGAAFIQSIMLKADAHEIDLVDSLWIYLWYNFYIESEERLKGVQKHIMYSFADQKFDEKQQMQTIIIGTKEYYRIPSKQIVIPIPFYFTKHTDRYFPLLLCPYSKINLFLVHRNMESLVQVKDPTNTWVSLSTYNKNTGKTHCFKNFLHTSNSWLNNNNNVQVFVKYIHISQVEKEALLHTGCDYITKHTRMYTFDQSINKSNYNIVSSKEFSVDCLLPIGELFWVIQDPEDKKNNDWFNFVPKQIRGRSTLEEQNSTSYIRKTIFKLHHHEFSVVPGNISAELIPSYYSYLPPGMNMYNFSLFPKKHNRPNGCLPEKSGLSLQINVNNTTFFQNTGWLWMDSNLSVEYKWDTNSMTTLAKNKKIYYYDHLGEEYVYMGTLKSPLSGTSSSSTLDMETQTRNILEKIKVPDEGYGLFTVAQNADSESFDFTAMYTYYNITAAKNGTFGLRFSL